MAAPRRISREEELDRYRQAMGDDAADRQEKLAKESCAECGWKAGGHHPACRKARRRR